MSLPRFAVLLAVAGITCSSVYSAEWGVRPSLLPATQSQSRFDPIKVQTYSDFVVFGPFSGQAQKLKILSVVDSVELQSITLNRGNCTVYGIFSGEPFIVMSNKLDITLKYGDTREFGTTCGEILEGVIKTNLGNFKF